MTLEVTEIRPGSEVASDRHGPPASGPVCAAGGGGRAL